MGSTDCSFSPQGLWSAQHFTSCLLLADVLGPGILTVPWPVIYRCSPKVHSVSSSFESWDFINHLSCYNHWTSNLFDKLYDFYFKEVVLLNSDWVHILHWYCDKRKDICLRKMPKHTRFLTTILRDLWITKTTVGLKDNFLRTIVLILN